MAVLSPLVDGICITISEHSASLIALSGAGSISDVRAAGAAVLKIYLEKSLMFVIVSRIHRK